MSHTLQIVREAGSNSWKPAERFDAGGTSETLDRIVSSASDAFNLVGLRRSLPLSGTTGSVELSCGTCLPYEALGPAHSFSTVSLFHDSSLLITAGAPVIVNGYVCYGANDLTISAYTSNTAGTGTIWLTPPVQEGVILTEANTPAPDSSELGRLIDDAFFEQIFEIEAKATAGAAARDAKLLVEKNELDGQPFIIYSEDGVLTLQWQGNNHGVALLFAGDGEASIAFKKPDLLYAQNGIDIKVTDRLPASFYEVLTTVLS